MSSGASPLYQYYAPPAAGNAGFNTSTDPRKIASNAAEFDVNTGGQLLNQDQAAAQEYAAQQGATQAYVNPIAQGLASGQGGYSPIEQQQILLSPEQQQAIKTGAGITAGAGTASTVGAAERAAAATGGNPAALATYRARAAQSMAGNAGNASTEAGIAAQQAGAQGAEQVGQARIGQQNTGVQFLGNEQAQQGQQALGEQGLGQQAYGTETSGLSSASDTGLKASQTPSTSDKIIGGIAGAASAFLEDGKPYEGDRGMDAVVGEDGPEMIVEGASDPVRSHTKFMDEGGGTPLPYQGPPVTTDPVQTTVPWWKQIADQAAQNKAASPTPSQPSQKSDWTPATPYQQLGQAVGGALGNASKAGYLADGAAPTIAPTMAEGRMGPHFHWSDPMPHAPKPAKPIFNYAARPHMADGGLPGVNMPPNRDPAISGPTPPAAQSSTPKLVTKPTLVHLDQKDAVIPLSYRAKAKIRPSAAIPAIQAMKQHRFFGAHA